MEEKTFERLYSKFSGMTEEEMANNSEELTAQITKLDEQIVDIDKQIAELEGAVADNPKGIDELKAKMKEIALRIAKEEAAKQKAEVESELKYSKGFEKNRDKLEKLAGDKGYKTRLEAQLATKKTQKENLEKKDEELRKERNRIIKRLKLLRDDTKIPEEELTDEMREELRTLPAKLESIKEELKNAKIEMKKTSAEIERLEQSISKCGLIQDLLMQDKDWDDIHAKSLETFKKYKTAEEPKRTAEETEVIEAVRGEEPTEELYREEPIEGAHGAVGYRKATETIRDGKPRSTEEAALVPQSEFDRKHPRLAKIKNTILNMASSLKNRFKPKENDTVEIPRGVADAEWESIDEPEELKGHESTEETRTHDAFVDRMRQMLEPDFKQEVRGKTEQYYIEKHQPKAPTLDKDDEEVR